MSRVFMPPIARGQTWLSQSLPVLTVPNTGRSLYNNSTYLAIEDSAKKSHDSNFKHDRKLSL